MNKYIIQNIKLLFFFHRNKYIYYKKNNDKYKYIKN